MPNGFYETTLECLIIGLSWLKEFYSRHMDKTPHDAFPYPTGIIRRIIQCPVYFYRLGLGYWLKWFPLLILTSENRISGAPHHVALEYRRHGSKYYLFSGWGERPSWVQNLKVNPTVTVQHGDTILSAQATIVTNSDEAMRALYMFRRNSFIYELILSKMSSADKIDFKTLSEVANQFTVIRIDPIEAPIALPGLQPLTNRLGPSLLFGLVAALTITVLLVFRQDESSNPLRPDE